MPHEIIHGPDCERRFYGGEHGLKNVENPYLPTHNETLLMKIINISIDDLHSMMEGINMSIDELLKKIINMSN